MQGSSTTNDKYFILGRLPHDLAFTQSKVLLIAVEKRYVGAGSSDVNNTIVVGCKIYSIVCTDTVTRV